MANFLQLGVIQIAVDSPRAYNFYLESGLGTRN